jgi:beta-galactosidase
MVSETRVETTGAPAALRLEAWKPGLKAKAGEADVVSVSAVDDKGRVVPTSMNRVSFTISGPARILGVGNGNPSCHEPDQLISPPSFRSVPITGWHCKEMALPPKPTDRRGNYDAVLGKFLAPLNDSAWPTSPVPEGKSGVCSATLTLSASDLKSPLLLRLEGFSGPHAFVNGSEIERAVRGKRPAPIGDCYPEGGGTVYRIPAALVHEGKNTLLVAVESGAPHPKASLESVGEPVPAQWSRSLFNGYAQVILGSTGQPGEVTLTATAEGLRPASVTIRAAAEPVAP